MLMCVVGLVCMVVFVIMCVGMHRVESVNNASGTEKQQCLEESMGGKVKESCDITANPNPKHHISELANRRVCQNPFNIETNDGNCRSDDRCNTTDIRDDERRSFCQNREHPSGEINASSNHRGGVNQSTDGCGTLHRIGQPCM